MIFKKHVEAVEEAISLFLSGLFPLSEQDKSLWSHPIEITELSFGVTHSGSGLFKYACGTPAKPLDERYPHYILCKLSEWRAFNKTVSRTLDQIDLKINLNIKKPQSIEEDSDEEYEWRELLESLEVDYQQIVLGLALTRTIKNWKFEISLASQCEFNIYSDYDEEQALGKLDFSEYPEYQNEIIQKLAKTPEEKAFIELLSVPGGLSIGDDNLPDFYEKAAKIADYGLL